MRKLMFFLGAVVLCALMGCSRENGPVPEIELASSQEDVIQLDPYENNVSIRFSSALEWHIEVQGGDDWVTVSPMEGQPGMARLTVIIRRNLESEKRTAVINICSGELAVPVTVEQSGFVPTFELLETETEISAAGGKFSVWLNADVDYECVVKADWIKEVFFKAADTREHTFTAEPNPSSESRTGTISFVYGEDELSYTVRQRPAGTEADDWKRDSFVHRSLAMRFTADWCGYCPNMASAFEEAETEMNGRFVTLSLHGGQSALEFDSISSLLSRFNVAAFPTGVVDARAGIPNYTNISTTAAVAMNVAKETQETYPAKTGIAVNSKLDGSELTVDLSLYVKEADTYRAVVVLIEDKIIGYQNGVVAPSKYVHNNIARLAITSISGESVNIGEDNTVWEKTFTATVPSVCDPANLRILVYVEKPYGVNEKVTGVEGAEYDDFGDRYVDNCRAVKVGENAPLELN